jgi:hypothetical protein
MNPLDVKRKVLGAVKGYGREGMGEMLKKGYGKPSVAIEIKSTKVEPEMGESEDEMPEDMMHEAKEDMAEGMMPKDAMKMADAEAEMPAPESKGESKITPELLEMLLAKLGK